MLSFSKTGVQKVVSDHALYIALNAQFLKNVINHLMIFTFVLCILILSKFYLFTN